ncbi:MAG: LytTR family DNA-binding domain-containing protein, partial [Ferruginibacter sp.]
SSGTGSIQTPVGSRSHVFFNVNKKMVKVYFDEIIYIESFKEYVRIVSKDRSILTKMQLTQVEELLSKDYFIRVHRSFLVSKEKIEAFTATDIDIVGKQIPIGRNYKQNVLLQLTEGQ